MKKDDIFTAEWWKKWIAEHCKPREVVEKEIKEATEEANNHLQILDKVEVTTEPITFYASEFKSERGFVTAMSIASKRFKDSNDVVVRYAKPEDKENGEIKCCFQILKSKAKVFYKHVKEDNLVFDFSLDSTSDIKACVKLFNSLGVKSEDGNSLSSKNIDTSKDMRDVFVKNENKIECVIRFNEDNDFVMLEWNTVEIGKDLRPYSMVESYIKDLINSH